MKKRIALIFGSVLILGAIVATSTLSAMYDKSQNPTPSPGIKIQNLDTDGMPEVDWEYWLNINPDIVGWITIPGTSIDHPVVQAHPDDPYYYLSHDQYGDDNGFGAVYLDADCYDEGMSSKNVIICGHNISGTMFGEIALYADATYAQEHSVILIQTPEWKDTLDVDFVNITNGHEQSKRAVFDDMNDFYIWYQERLTTAEVVLAKEELLPTRNYSLVSCSYYFNPSNERTVVFAS